MVAAVRDSFDRVVSIELSPELHRRAEERFCGDPRIRIVLGDSSSALTGILQELREPCLFWLDAHYSGGVTARGSVDTPITRELDVLLERDLDDVILIDDARLFVGTDGYPPIEAVQSLIATRRRGWLCSVVSDVIRIRPPVDGSLQ
jgi:hypothetical protein